MPIFKCYNPQSIAYTLPQLEDNSSWLLPALIDALYSFFRSPAGAISSQHPFGLWHFAMSTAQIVIDWLAILSHAIGFITVPSISSLMQLWLLIDSLTQCWRVRYRLIFNSFLLVFGVGFRYCFLWWLGILDSWCFHAQEQQVCPQAHLSHAAAPFLLIELLSLHAAIARIFGSLQRSCVLTEPSVPLFARAGVELTQGLFDQWRKRLLPISAFEYGLAFCESFGCATQHLPFF